VGYPHVRVSGTERAQQLRGRRRAWEDQANFVTDATNSRSEEGGTRVTITLRAGGEATTHLEGAVERRAGPTTWEKEERGCAEPTLPPPPRA